MNKRQNKLYQSIYKQEDILNLLETKIDVKDLSVVIGTYIKENGITDEAIMNKVSSFFKSELTSILFINPKIETEYITLISCIKNRISKLDKSITEQQNERKLLKSCFKDINDIIDVYDNIEVKTSNYYDIVDYFINREDGLLYLKETLKSIPDIANIKYNDKHIIIIILERYIYNFKKLLEDKNSNYINPYYLYEVFSSFIRSRYISLNTEVRNTLINMLEEFKVYIKNTLIKEKRKNAALDEVKKVNKELNNYVNYTNTFKIEKYDINEDYLARLHTRVMEDVEEKYKYKDIVTKDAFTLNSNSYAYSSFETEDEVIVEMHVPNVSPYISGSSDIKLYYWNDLVSKLTKDGTIDPMYEVYIKKYDLIKDHKYPCITYQLIYTKNGTFKKFNITQSDIYIKEKYKVCEDYYFLMNKPIDESVMYKDIHKLFRNIISKNNISILDNSVDLLNAYYEYTLNQEFASFMSNNKIPCIFYNKLKNSDELTKEHLFNLNNYLYKLDKEEYNNILNILNRNPDKYHYSILYNNKNEYKLDILSPCSYLALEIQNIINVFIYNSRHLEGDNISKLKKMYADMLYKLSNELNDYLSYTNEEYLKMNKGRIKVKKLPNNYISKKL